MTPKWIVEIENNQSSNNTTTEFKEKADLEETPQDLESDKLYSAVLDTETEVDRDGTEMEGETSKEDHMRLVGAKWSQTSDKDKEALRERARQIRSYPLKGMEADKGASYYIDKLGNSCSVLSSLGYEMTVAMKENEAPHIFGSTKGPDYIQNPIIMENFRRGVFSNTSR